MRKRSLQEIEHEHANNPVTGLFPVVLILDNLRSLHNVGSVFRTAEAMGVKELYLCGFTGRPPQRDLHKAALGAEFRLSWKEFPSTLEAVRHAWEHGYRVVALEQTHDSTPLQAFAWNGEPLALVLGNEVHGVDDEALEVVSEAIEIPQWGTKHSFNVVVSVGIVLWHLRWALNFSSHGS